MSGPVKRYYCNNGWALTVAPDGGFVSYDDYEQAIRERDEERADAAKWKEAFEREATLTDTRLDECGERMKAERDDAVAEIEKWKAAFEVEKEACNKIYAVNQQLYIERDAALRTLAEAEESIRYLLDTTTEAVRVCPGGLKESLIDSLSVNYIALRDAAGRRKGR